MKRIITSAILFTFLVTSVCAQNGSSTAAPDKKAVKNATAINYYGADFSHVRVTDAPKIVKGPEYSKVYPSGWIAFLEKEMPADKDVRKMLGKRDLPYLQKEIRQVSLGLPPDFIISDNYSFPEDTLKAAVRGYDLSAKSGVGLVLIPENFNKPEEKAYTWVVFFDIATRNILWSAKVSGDCKHMGYTAHWASGVIDGFSRFANREF